MTADQHCAHPGCTCRVPPGQEYCSYYCREQMEKPNATVVARATGGCGCGHRDCGDAPAA